MKARILVNKGKKLEQRIHDLQFDIYNYSSDLKDAGINNISELAGESAFELDVSHIKMKECWQRIEDAFCNKITKK